MPLNLEDISEITYTDVVTRIKIYYIVVVQDPELVDQFPPYVLHTLKEKTYVYYDELTEEIQYDIAYYLLKKLGVIRTQVNGSEYLFYDTFKYPEYQLNTPAPLLIDPTDPSVRHQVIVDFQLYSKYNGSIFVPTVDWEYDTSVRYTKTFLDTKINSLSLFEIDPVNYSVNIIKNFIYTHVGSVPFQPHFGSKIKNYLHTLSSSLASLSLKEELQALGSNIEKIVNKEEDVLNIVIEDVYIDESDVSGNLYMTISLKVNEKQYEIKVQ